MTTGRTLAIGMFVAQSALAPTPGAAEICVGDCNDNGSIGINELVRGVRMALQQDPVAGCPSFDLDSSGSISISELVRSVNHALTGCERRPTPTPTLPPPTRTPRPTVFCQQDDPGSFAPTSLRFPRRLLEPGGRIAIGDINGDAYDDVVIGTFSHPSAAYLGTPTRVFGPKICIPAPSVVPIIADLTNDGIAELLLHDRDQGVLETFTYSGESAFSQEFAGTIDGRTLHLGHLDRDGSLDLIGFALGPNRAHLYLGDGAGGFSAIEGLTIGTATRAIAVADLNRDGTVELIATERTDTAAIFVGRGDGTFDPPKRYEARITGADILVADFDHDGIADIVTIDSSYSQLAFLKGMVDASVEQGRVVAITPSFRTFNTPSSGDFDGDGRLDIAATSSSNGNALLLFGDGTGDFPRQERLDQREAPAGIWPGDLDGNGERDLVRPVRGGAIEVDFREANGFLERTSVGPIMPPQATAVHTVDGDEFPDLVLIDSTGRLTVHLGDGAGSLKPLEIVSEKSLGFGVSAHRIHTIEDMNGDTFADLVWSMGSTSAVLYGTGDGEFELREENIRPTGMRELIKAQTGDISGDGLPDVLAVFAPHRGFFQSIWAYESRPEGGFTKPTEIPFPFTELGSTWIQDLAVADLNTDGTADLAAVNGNRIVLAWNDGTSLTWQTELSSDSVSMRSVDAVDVDGDNVIDLVATGNNRSTLVFFGTKDGSFSEPAQRYTMATDPAGQWFTDLDGDGLVDLAVVDRDDNYVSIRLGIDSGTLGDETRFAIEPFAVADMDRDGVADLISLGPDRDRIDIFYGESVPGATELQRFR